MSLDSNELITILNELFNTDISEANTSNKLFILDDADITNKDFESAEENLSQNNISYLLKIFEKTVVLNIPKKVCELNYFMERLKKYHNMKADSTRLFEDIKDLFWKLRDRNDVNVDILDYIKSIEKKVKEKKLPIGLSFCNYKNLYKTDYEKFSKFKNRIKKRLRQFKMSENVKNEKIIKILKNFVLHFDEDIVFKDVKNLRNTYIHYDLACFVLDQGQKHSIPEMGNYYLGNIFGATEVEKKNFKENILIFLPLVKIKRGLLRIFKNKSGGERLLESAISDLK